MESVKYLLNIKKKIANLVDFRKVFVWLHDLSGMVYWRVEVSVTAWRKILGGRPNAKTA